jgi:hypothetical protein
MSAIFDAAAEQYRACKAAFEDYRENQYRTALNDLGGRLLNRAALAAGIDSWSLFIGSHQRADRWASEELREWWGRHRRLTYTEFEKQYVEQTWEAA